MRRKNAKHAQAVPGKSKDSRPLLKRTYMKAVSFCLAFALVAAVLTVPSMTLAPDVEAIANQKAIAFSVGDLEDFSSVISSVCGYEETQPATEQETTEAVEETTAPATEAETEPETEEVTEPATEAQKQETEETYEEQTSSSIVSQVSNSVSKSDYLLTISNPDPNYAPGTVTLSAADRDLLERLVMGEAGSLGFTGCALIAQAIKDTMVLEGTASVSRIISEYNYSASVSVKANSAAVEAVNYVFDQNGSAVQHRILYFYESNICSSDWHESQNFIIDYNGVRFFDRW